MEEALFRLQQLYLQQAMNAHSTRVKEPLGITLPAIKPRIRTQTFVQILPGPKHAPEKGLKLPVWTNS